MTIRLSDHFSYKKLLRFVLPSIAMMVFISIYGVVDGLFVSNFAGKTPFASINLIMSFTFMLGGMGFMVGTGGTALVAKTLGEGDDAQANRYFTMMVSFTVLLGIVLSVIGIAVVRPVSLLLGATEAMLPYCVTYGRIVIAFTPAFMLQNVFQNFLIAAEKPKLGLTTTVAAGITNMVLDAVFIAGLRWGVAGAAFATGISQCVGSIIPLLYFLRPNDSLLHLGRPTLSLKPIVQACSNGISEFMSNISTSIVSVVYNLQLIRMIGEDGVSAYGVLLYVQFIFIAIFVGFSIGSAPVVSYHYGAENHQELKSLLGKSTVLMLGGGVVLTALAVVLAGPFAKLFVGYDAALFALTKHAFRLFAASFLLAGFNIFASGYFTALNNGLVSAVISFLRTLVFQLLSVLLLPLVLDTDGIWWAISVAEVFAFLFSLFFLAKNRKKYHYW